MNLSRISDYLATLHCNEMNGRELRALSVCFFARLSTRLGRLLMDCQVEIRSLAEVEVFIDAAKKFNFVEEK